MTGGGFASRSGPGFPVEERGLCARVKSRLRVEDGEVADDSEETEWGMAMVLGSLAGRGGCSNRKERKDIKEKGEGELKTGDLV